MTVYAQVAEGEVVGVFSSPQDPEYWPNVEEIEEEDPRLIAYLDSANLKGTL